MQSVRCGDVKNAFLNDELSESLYEASSWLLSSSEVPSQSISTTTDTLWS